MEPSEVTLKSWIKIGPDGPFRGLDGYVLRTFSPGHLSVGYYSESAEGNTSRCHLEWKLLGV